MNFNITIKNMNDFFHLLQLTYATINNPIVYEPKLGTERGKRDQIQQIFGVWLVINLLYLIINP